MPRKAPGRRPRHLLRATTALRSMHVAHPAPYRAGRRHGGRSHRGVVVLSTGQYGGADRAAVLVDAGGSPGTVVRQAPAGGQHSTFTRSPKAGDQFAVNIYHAAKDTSFTSANRSLHASRPSSPTRRIGTSHPRCSPRGTVHVSQMEAFPHTRARAAQRGMSRCPDCPGLARGWPAAEGPTSGRLLPDHRTVSGPVCHHTGAPALAAGGALPSRAWAV